MLVIAVWIGGCDVNLWLWVLLWLFRWYLFAWFCFADCGLGVGCFSWWVNAMGFWVGVLLLVLWLLLRLFVCCLCLYSLIVV